MDQGAAGSGYDPPAAVPDGFAAGSNRATGAFEAGENAGGYPADAVTEAHETDEPAETRDASDPAPRWSLDDLPAPPRYPRR